MAIADAGGIMPPKSTWFEPKLRDGCCSIHLISGRHAAMVVLIADKFGGQRRQRPRGRGCRVILDPELRDAALGDALRSTRRPC